LIAVVEELAENGAAPEGFDETTALTARLKASPDTNPWFFSKL
jgi:hypothetical protein